MIQEELKVSTGQVGNAIASKVWCNRVTRKLSYPKRLPFHLTEIILDRQFTIMTTVVRLYSVLDILDSYLWASPGLNQTGAKR